MLPPPQLARLREHALGQTVGPAPLRRAAGTASPWRGRAKGSSASSRARRRRRSIYVPLPSYRARFPTRPDPHTFSRSRRVVFPQASPRASMRPPNRRDIPNIKKRPVHQDGSLWRLTDYLARASSTATAQATLAPTMGLLPMPIRPIISTCAGTEEEPANWASECMRPMVSVMP